MIIHIVLGLVTVVSSLLLFFRAGRNVLNIAQLGLVTTLVTGLLMVIIDSSSLARFCLSGFALSLFSVLAIKSAKLKIEQKTN